MHTALAAAASIKNLKGLDLSFTTFDMPSAAKLAALTGVTQLSINLYRFHGAQHYRAVADGIGRMAGLRQLCVSSVVVLQEGCAWLGGLQQLQVLIVSYQERAPGSQEALMKQLLDWCHEAPPPALRLLWVESIKAEQAAAWRLRHCQLGQLSNSSCELVVGPGFDDVAGPAQQLAGLPAGLQQVFVRMQA
jgi:hypothetical protein